MRRTASLLSACAAVAVLLPSAAHGWGFTAHQYITARAIALLPAAIRPFFLKYETTVVEHSIDPDTYRTMGWIEEPPRHFVDMDAYGPFPFAELPHDYDAAVAKYGKEFVEKNGLLPWRLQQVHDWLTEAFKQQTPYARDNIKLFAAVLSHYLADAYQPLHATTNYDGQLTGQQGVHARFETELFERFRSRLDIRPGPLVPVSNAREFAFATLGASHQLVDPVLAADRDAVDGRDEYDDVYFDRFFAKSRPLLEKRLGETVTGVASLIAAAWEAAGRPALPLEAPARPPRKVRRTDR
ncbi:MAG: hypothetical protein DMF85_18620 [Acidobacteria bacterium]|nr:MAG: hypothetical protein DMF85_18620 [Acidobacteriota bacterium]